MLSMMTCLPVTLNACLMQGLYDYVKYIKQGLYIGEAEWLLSIWG